MDEMFVTFVVFEWLLTILLLLKLLLFMLELHEKPAFLQWQDLELQSVFSFVSDFGVDCELPPVLMADGFLAIAVVPVVLVKSSSASLKTMGQSSRL